MLNARFWVTVYNPLPEANHEPAPASWATAAAAATLHPGVSCCVRLVSHGLQAGMPPTPVMRDVAYATPPVFGLALAMKKAVAPVHNDCATWFPVKFCCPAPHKTANQT